MLDHRLKAAIRFKLYSQAVPKIDHRQGLLRDLSGPSSNQRYPASFQR